MTKEQTFAHPPRGHVALLAYDSANDRFQVVHVDASGLLQVDIAAQAIDVEVTQVTPADLVVASHGYDGAAWRKQPLLWGYTDRIVSTTIIADAATGDNFITLGAVPAGEIWVIEAMSAVDDDNIASNIYFGAYNGTAWLWLEQVVSPAAGVYQSFTGVLRLKAGDNCGILIKGAILNDYLAGNFVGYKMSIDM